MKSIVISPEPGTKPGAKDVCDTPNDRDTRAIVRAMNGWPVMRRSLAQNREPFCARVAQNDGAGWLTTGRMNASAFMRPSLPQKPELEGAQCAPSSPVARLRMESMKARLMQWRLPEKPRPHCEPQSQSLPQSWVRNGPLKTC